MTELEKRTTALRMAFTSAAPTGHPDDRGTYTDRRKRQLITRAVWLWLGGVVVITVVAVAFILHGMSNRPAEGTVTVGEAIAGTESATGAEAAETEGGESGEEGTQQYPGYRLVELASALGLPNGAVPDGAFEMGMSHDQARIYLMDLVNQAVTKGVLTPAEADGVLKAFEAGLVSAPVNITEDKDGASADNSESADTDRVGSSN